MNVHSYSDDTESPWWDDAFFFYPPVISDGLFQRLETRAAVDSRDGNVMLLPCAIDHDGTCAITSGRAEIIPFDDLRRVAVPVIGATEAAKAEILTHRTGDLFDSIQASPAIAPDGWRDLGAVLAHYSADGRADLQAVMALYGSLSPFELADITGQGGQTVAAIRLNHTQTA